MIKLIIAAVVVIALTIGIVWLIDKFVPKKIKPALLLALWALIIWLGYITFNSVYGEIRFNKLKDRRYAEVIPALIDVRDAQLAHKTVTGNFQSDWKKLVEFIDTAQFTITQRIDSTVIDEDLTRRYGVTTTKEIVIIDTLGFVSVKDSLFGADPRYKTIMNVPVGEPNAKFDLQVGSIEQNDIQIPVFEAKVLKSVILFDQPKDLITKENQIISVDQVNGEAIRVGSMEEVNTNGNWPKNYSNQQ